jgi:hypothetical protein
MLSKAKKSRLRFWGRALAHCTDLHLTLAPASRPGLQQMAAAAPGGIVSGVTWLSVKVGIITQHLLAPSHSSSTSQALSGLSPSPCLGCSACRCCLWPQAGGITTSGLSRFPSLQRLSLEGRTQLQLHEGSPWVPPAQLRRLAVHRDAGSTLHQLLPALHTASGLQRLQLDGLYQKARLLSPVLQYLSTSLPQLVHLGLPSCGMGSSDAAALAPTLQQMTSLHVL